ncbi:UDP-N-acetylglucosamine transferase subunit ALG13 [Caenorhabditis elegans]|uniref:UDP-N-acetylglucosamine transferase subunit ALG13 n=1 Tax=Caenorhabditis elegans TaxID=6239 RepID=P92012_CAEEL|nr:N-acetylglucosaminyldiphosphodolichol N-acetylglucosaminyltransferase [Caenorhabditis elegans]CAB03253.2 N-acetylglucosaminyldiphosphodolichol N-acetylglucosaminyltransferase [Caenorhabditis elegans]|eukprot:NP_506467.1 Asparagine Linked Glycosylation (ALG) homolog, Nematode [Caenorhabditis elegans]
MSCFVTVGSTLFEDLINQVLCEASLENLKKIGVKKIRLQIGKGNFNQDVIDRVFGETSGDEGSVKCDGLDIDYYRYKPSLSEDMAEALIVIGHGGAGTCLEVLALHLPFITVTNDKLMDNHQAELAVQLSDEGYLLQCTPSTLPETILKENLFSLRQFAAPSKKFVAEHIKQLVGIKNH